MAEKLSVTTAIIGLLAVGGRTIDTIWDLNLPAHKATPVLNQALHEVRQVRSTVHILYKTFALLESARLPFPDRGTWIAVDDLIATLTDTVLAFSDLQSICVRLEAQRQGLSPPPACAAAACEPRVAALCARVRWHNLSLSMMTTILRCPGEADARNARVGLDRRMARLLTSNAVLAARMRQLDDVFAAESLPHYTQPSASCPPSPLGPTAAAAASSSSSYPAGPRRARAPTTPYSGYTLAGIPVLSIIPLPVTTAELFDGPEVYSFAYARRVGPDLGELMRCQPGQGTTRSLGAVLGRSADAPFAASTSTGGSSSSDGCVPAVLQQPSPPPHDDAPQPSKKRLRFRKMVRVKPSWRAS